MPLNSLVAGWAAAWVRRSGRGLGGEGEGGRYRCPSCQGPPRVLLDIERALVSTTSFRHASGRVAAFCIPWSIDRTWIRQK